MKTFYIFRKCILLSLLMILGSSLAFAQFRVVGYMPSWSGSASQIQYDKLTHINYAFVLPTATGGLQSLENPAKLQSIVSSAHANGVKVLIAVGGWNNGDDSAFESLAANATYRSNFVTSLINLVNQYNLDGVDMDWEYPDPGASAENYATMMQQLSQAMHSRGKLLTAAVVGSDYAGGGILNSVFSYVDFLNIMAYDANNYDHSTYEYAVQALNYWKNRGLPANKAVLGVPFYGRPSWESFAQLVARGADPYSDTFSGVGYNGITTIKRKTNLAFDQAGGIMIWELAQDATGTNSLLTAIDQVVDTRGGTNPPPTCSGNYLAVPGRIQAENYCMMNGIQLEGTTDTGAGQNVGWIDAGDWMDFAVNVASAGTYKVDFRVASANGGGQLQLRSGATTLATVAVPSTGGWQNWTTVSATIQLSAGTQTLRIYAGAGGWNFNWMEFSSATPAGFAIPGTIEAESYSTMNGVQTEATTDTGAGRNVGWIDAGDWMDYPVSVASAGTYTVEFRVASANGGGQLQLRSGASTLATVNIAATGGWQSWTTVSTTATLAAGNQTIRLYASAGGFNINWVKFSSGGGGGGSSACTFTAATGDYTARVSSDASNPTITFVPSRTGVGATTLILYYGTSATSPLAGYTVSANTAYRINAAAGQTVYFYYTYSVPEGGERNTSTSRHSFTTGNCAAGARLVSAAEQAEVDSKGLEFYPNPATQTLQILQADNYLGAAVSILDASGRTVYSGLLNSDKLDVYSLPAGKYLLRIISSDQIQQKRFIKQ